MKLFEQGAFTVAPGTTPEQLEKKREAIRAMLDEYGRARYTGEGVADLFTGIANGMHTRKLDKYETEQRSAANDAFSALFGGSGGASAGGGQPMPQGTPFAPEGVMPDGSPGVRSDAYTGGGKGEFVRYANQGAIRNKPISGDLQSALSFLPELGITMEVYSGGQDAKGHGDRRTGSVRHDHGNAADVFFYNGDGRKLDWGRAEDVPVLQEIVQRAKANGVTGFGAGPGYMQQGSMHIGFGAPAVWGAGGKGANAPDWLRAAYNGAPSGPAPAAGGQPPAAQGSQQYAQLPGYNGPAMADLQAAMANPWLSPTQKQMIAAQMQQAQQAQDPMRNLEYQRAQQQLALGNIQLQQAQNPQPKQTDDMLEYELAKSQGYQGTFSDYMMAMRASGAATPAGAKVQSSVVLDDGTSVLIMSDGTRQVISATGDPLTGQAAADAIKDARTYTVANQTDIYSGRRAGTLSSDIAYGGEAEAVKDVAKATVDAGISAWESYGKLQASLSNIDEAIRAIDSGAASGLVYKMLPSITEASASLENAMNRMGLDVVGAVTFGALSEGELRLAMETAAPRNLGPAELRSWLVRRQAAQEKAAAMAADAAQFLTVPGNTINDWIAKNKAQRAQQPAAPLAQQPAPQPAAQQPIQQPMQQTAAPVQRTPITPAQPAPVQGGGLTAAQIMQMSPAEVGKVNIDSLSGDALQALQKRYEEMSK